MIRRASLDDTAAIAALNIELGYSAEEDEMRMRLEAVLAASGQAVFVSQSDAQITGWIHLAIVPSLETETYVEIRGVIVGSDFRNRGTGASLVSAGEEWARMEGMSRMRVRSNVARERTRRFYERLGYRVTKAQNVFDRQLDASAREG